MIAADTNLFARLLLKDDPEQYRRALAALSTDEQIFVPVTVMLELAWVLSARDIPRADCVAALRSIAQWPNARLQHAASIRRALSWSDEGMDVADAIHLALSETATRFITFDNRLRRQAKRLGTKPPVAAP